MKYEIEITDGDQADRTEAYSPDEAGDQIAELLDEYGQGSFMIDVQAFEE